MQLGYQWAGISDLLLGQVSFTFGPAARLMLGMKIEDAVALAQSRGWPLNLGDVWANILQCSVSDLHASCTSFFIVKVEMNKGIYIPPLYIFAMETDGPSSSWSQCVLHSSTTGPFDDVFDAETCFARVIFHLFHSLVQTCITARRNSCGLFWKCLTYGKIMYLCESAKQTGKRSYSLGTYLFESSFPVQSLN